MSHSWESAFCTRLTRAAVLSLPCLLIACTAPEFDVSNDVRFQDALGVSPNAVYELRHGAILSKWDPFPPSLYAGVTHSRYRDGRFGKSDFDALTEDTRRYLHFDEWIPKGTRVRVTRLVGHWNMSPGAYIETYAVLLDHPDLAHIEVRLRGLELTNGRQMIEAKNGWDYSVYSLDSQLQASSSNE